MWDQRVLILEKLQSLILDNLHESHFGIVIRKIMTKSIVWCPNIVENIKEFSKGCEYCVEVRNIPEKNKTFPLA